MKWLWYALGALLLLALLGWLLGLFGGHDEEEAVTVEPVETEEVVVTEEPATGSATSCGQLGQALETTLERGGSQRRTGPPPSSPALRGVARENWRR